MTLSKAVETVEQTIKNKDKIKVITHCDVDGLTSYTILKKTLDRLEADFDINYISHVSDETLDKLELNEYDLILFADLGSSSLHTLDKHKALHGKTVIILDHHYPLEITPNFKLIHVNPNLCGYTGDSSACGATLSYLFAREFGYTDLAKYAILGAIGDAQSSNSGCLEDFNLTPIHDMKNELVVENALQLYGKFSRPLILALKYSSNIFSDFNESDNNVLAFLYKILKETGVDIPYHKPYCRLSDKHIKILSTYLYKYMKKFIPKEFHKVVNQCLYGKSYHLNEDIENIIKTPWKYDFEEMPSFLNASIRIKQYDLVANYLLSGKNEKMLYNNYRKYKQKLSISIRSFDQLCEYDQLSNIQYYIAYTDSGIDTTMSGVLAGMLYSKPYFSYVKPNIGIVEFEDGWKISIRGSKILQYTTFHAGHILIKLSEKYNGSAGGHKLAAGSLLDYNVDLDKYIQDLNTTCYYNILI